MNVDANSTTSVRVYKYGLRSPIENAELVIQQMVLGHKYRNTLVEIERGRRDAIRELYRTAGDEGALDAELARATESVESVLAEIRRTRAKLYNAHVKTGDSSGRSKAGARVTPPELAAKLKVAKEARKTAAAAVFAYRKTLREELSVRAEVERIDGLANELAKSARKFSGLYWGTYLLIERAMQASRKQPLYEGAEANDPRFVTWPAWKREALSWPSGGHLVEAVDGVVAVQIQAQADKSAFLCKHAFGSDTRLRIELVEDRKGRPNRGWAILRLRVGSTETGKPIFAAWPMKMDRPLPECGVISWVAVHLNHVGPREVWTVSITVKQQGPMTRSRGREHKPILHQGQGVVAVNFGWRWLGEELRVATWRSLDGRSSDIRLTADMIEDLRMADQIRSRRDKEFDKAREILVEWLRVGEVPEWLREKSKTLADWKSPLRLVALVQRWARDRAAGDEVAFAALEAWRYHDRHLWIWESEQRTRALRRRDDLFSRLGAMLAQNFKTLVIEDFNITRVARRALTDGDWQNTHVASNRHLTAPGEHREILKRAFVSRGGEVVTVPAVDNTRTCHVCGLVEAFDASKSVDRSPPCSGCGAVWDQDDNNVRQQLKRYEVISTEREQVGDGTAIAGGGLSETSKRRGGRWAKTKAKRVVAAVTV